MTGPLLEARAVSAGYNGHAVVHELDLEVGAGEIVALLGPNGAGKTTTILTLAGELRPLAGEVALYGRPSTAALYKRSRDGLSLVAEERTLFTQLTVRENLRVGGCDQAVVVDLFPELEKLLRRRAGLLSGGEQQMLALARALSRRPRLLLVDELSLGLGPLVVTRLLRAVRKAADDGVGVLLVEQHVNQVLQVADRGYVLRRGRIAMHGASGEISSRVAATYLDEHAPPRPSDSSPSS